MVEFKEVVNVILNWEEDSGTYSGIQEIESGDFLFVFYLWASVVGKTIDYGYMHESEFNVLSFDIFVDDINVYDEDGLPVSLELADFKRLGEEIKNNVTYE